MILRSDRNSFVATVGCYLVIGGCKEAGDKIEFTAAAETLMGCPPPLAEYGRRTCDPWFLSVCDYLNGRMTEETLRLPAAASTILKGDLR